MAETPGTSEHDPSLPPATPPSGGQEGEMADQATGPAALEAVLAEALDEDDLPDPHPPAPTPPLQAATARPAVPGAAELPTSVAAAGEPTVAKTLDVAPWATPPAPGGPGEGGEWDVLVGKVKSWWEQADLPGQWDRLGGPLRGLGILLGALLVFKLYLAVLDTLDDLPLLPRLLQLVGLLALLNFSLTRLTRSSDRQVILEDWKRRWDAFRGA